MDILFVLNDAPYGIERTYNGLRLACELSRREGNLVRVFLMGDAVATAKTGQEAPEGYYNLERMLRIVASGDGEVAACGSCLDVRGFAEEAFTDAARRGSLDELADWVQAADRVLTY